jgi:hypothetical protein
MATNNKKGFPVTEPILTPEVRLAFAQHIMVPEEKTKMDSDETYNQWSAALLMPKEGTDFSAIKNMCMDAIRQAWPDEKDRPRKFNVTLKDGDSGDHTKDGVPPAEKYQGFEGHMSLNAMSYRQPGIVHKDNVRVPLTNPDDVYSGCYGIAQIAAQAYKNTSGAGVRILLLNFMKTREGEPLTGGAGKPKAEDAFAAFAGEEEKTSTGGAFDGLF